jgi:hypothetical protein
VSGTKQLAFPDMSDDEMQTDEVPHVEEIPGRWDHVDYLLRRNSAFTAPGFEPDTIESPSV